MAIDWTKDVRSLSESDIAGLSADEKKILGRLCASEPIYCTHDLDPLGVPMEYAGNGSKQVSCVRPGSVVVALLKGWTKS